MNTLRPPMNAAFRNTLIMMASGLAASLLSVTVYGATLPVDEPAAASVAAASAGPSAQDIAAAAALRAMLAGQRPLFGVEPDGRLRR